MFTYIGGMQITPLPMNAPSRMADPPGTSRTWRSSVSVFSGIVSLSKNDHRP